MIILHLKLCAMLHINSCRGNNDVFGRSNDDLRWRNVRKLLFHWFFFNINVLKLLSLVQTRSSTTAFHKLVEDVTKHEEDIDPNEDENYMHDHSSPVVELHISDASYSKDVVKHSENKSS